MLEASGIPAPIVKAMSDKGYENLTPVQEEVFKDDYSGLDLLVSAQTGSGKTIAFGLAIVENILSDNSFFKTPKSPEALIIVPTRELALQVKNELSWLLASSEAKIASCVGGMDIRTEKRNLETKPNIVVGTPGRLKDHIERNHFNVSNIKTVVLDEADEMLDMGFREDLEAILDTTPDDRQTLMFSATVPKGIANLAKRYQKDAVRISIGKSNSQHVDIEYRAFKIVMSDQENAIINTLRYYEATNAIIFCATRIAVNHMTSRLTNRGISAVALSGELSQNERNMALQAMRTSKARVCVATDVAARGLDLPNLDLVIHADIPRTSDTLLHRSGRTGRAGRKGVCAVLVPQNRSRIAERLFGQANVKPIWASPPSREEILEEDKKRIVENKILENPITNEEQELVNELISKNSIEQLAAAYYRLIGKDLSAPEDLRNPSDKSEKRSKGNGFQNSIWFELSVGKDDTAEPRWLVALISDTGIRLAEAVGLMIQDIHLDHPYPHLKLKPHPHRSLKTRSSERTIPLVGASLWAAKQILASSTTDYCFPRYTNATACNSNSASAAINKWIKTIAGDNVVIHGFRHSFRDRLRQVEAPSDLIDQLGGWSLRSVGHAYGNGYSIEVLRKWTKRIVICGLDQLFSQDR